MEKLFKESYTYKIILGISHWIQKIFAESMLVGFFTNESTLQMREESVFSRIFKKLFYGIQILAQKLRLPQLLEGSIFTKPMIWLSITFFLTPFVSTMMTLAMLMFTLVTLILKMVIEKDFQFDTSRTTFFVLLFLLCILIFGFFSISKEGTKQIVLLIGMFVFSYFIVIHTVENPKQLRFLMYLFIFAGTISAVYGIYQYAFGDVFTQAWIDQEMFEDIRMRVYSTFENPNVYGEYLILVIPVILALLWTEKGWFKKIILLGMLGITTLAAVLTFSRGCWLAIILEIGILLLIIDKRFIFLGILALMMAPFILPTTIISRFASIGDLKDTSTSYRVNIWYGTVDMLKEYWVSGVGVGTASFNAVYPMYSYNGVSAQHSHNLFLQLMSSYGILGLVMFLWIIYSFYKETTISLLKKKNILLASIGSGITGFLLESMFDYTWYNYRVLLIFWMYLALGIALNKLERKEV